MFVDINSEQRKVKRSLLVELDADLKWNADEEEDRIQAIISKVGLALDDDIDSPLRNMILLADVKRTDIRCVSLTSVSSALGKSGFFIVSRKRDFTEYGPLWRMDQMACLKRAIYVIKSWFAEISVIANEWWKLGAGEGGGLAMNNGVSVRKKVDERINENAGKSGGREQNFDLIHYREIITNNWDLFKGTFGMPGTGGSKDKQTRWIKEIGDMRNIVMHPSRQQFLSSEKIQTLQQWVVWLRSRITKMQTGTDAAGDAEFEETEV